MLKRATLFVLVAIWCSSAQAEVQLKMVTVGGFVAFTVKDHWPVISMATEPPIMAAIFQLPNSADEGTPESTNLVIRFFDLKVDAAREEFRRVGKPITGPAPVPQAFQGWTVYRQRAHQGETEYSIMDAKRDLDSVSVAARLAWPHLAGNSPAYADEMEQTFRSVLTSISEHIGPWERGENEVIRRHSP